MEDVIVHLRHCLKQFHDGTLQAKDIERAISAAGTLQSRPQSLLYVQTVDSDPYSDILGMSIYEDGVDHEAENEVGDFLYPSIRHAQKDGWRIIKFPELAVMMQDQHNYGLGYEFVLERHG